MSAGATMTIRLTHERIDAAALETLVAHPAAGGLCTFQGIVRDHHAGRAVDYLVYEAYEPMAQAALEALGEAVASRWPTSRVAIAHRLGRLAVGEASVVIAVSAPHRAEAFEACRYAIDTLKTTVPIWKHEFGPDGASWVEGVPLEAVAATPADNHEGPFISGNEDEDLRLNEE